MTNADPPQQSSRDSQPRYPLPSGTRVDHYVIREVLGSGGFGITYLAEHEALGKQYAIKEYFPHAFSYRQGESVRPTSSGDGTYNWGLDRFVTEARALAKFKHPAIVDVTSIFEANGTAYIVLAYEAGQDMSSWLKSLGRPPTQDEIDRVLKALLSALEEVHRHSMMHRDISPDNLLIRDDGRPVLIDFGSARVSIRGRARALSAIVKHGYSPPEQYTSRPELQGPWTDIYALSATLYRAISGKLPPDATERIVRDDLQPLARVARAAYRPTFMAAVDRGLRMKVEERPQSIVEWREALFANEALQAPELDKPAEPSSAPGPAGRSAQISAKRPSERRAQAPLGRSAAAARSQAAGSSVNVGSRRVSDRSLQKSERPDLSWMDDEQTVHPQVAPQSEGRKIGQIITYGLLGLGCGALAGALFSIILSSIISTDCFADNCIFDYLAVCSAVGGLIGLGGGLRFGKMAADKPEIQPDYGLGGPPPA